jgi:ribonuclease HII
MATICGVEDAGRGPVIGPLVMAGVLINEKDEKKLVDIGVKDSKLLTPEKREELFNKIKKIAKSYKIIVLSPQDVDDALKSQTLNLNWLEAIASAKIINALKPDKAIIDCPSTNIRAYADYMGKNIKIKCETVVEHKADLNYPVVGAASILAKVTRDREIEKIKKKIGENFGSGYTSDPVTREFLEKNYDKYPEIFRHTWETYKKLVRNKSQKGLGEFS